MLGLIKKDMLLVVKNLSFVYLFSFLVVILPVSNNPALLMPIISFLISITLASQISATMGLDENAKWKRMVTAMPILTHEEVASKYLLSIIFAIISGILVIFLGFIVTSAIPAMSLNFGMILFFAAACFSLGMLYNAIMIPATYKFGAAKSRFVLFAFVTIPTFVTFILSSLKINISIEDFNMTIEMLSILMVLVLLVILTISFFISVKIQKKLG